MAIEAIKPIQLLKLILLGRREFEKS